MIYHKISDSDLESITKCVFKNTGICLSNFKPAFISRRVRSRMFAYRLQNISEYLELIQKDRCEVANLCRSLSVNVTRFFRDEEIWKAFSSNILPFLIKNSPDGSIRVWSVGCASGEEPYTIAILLSQASLKYKINYKIFAMDVSNKAIENAKKGIYPISALTGLDENTISNYFVMVNDSEVRVIPELQKNMEFFVKNINDFSAEDVDIIFCRNVLIYFDKDAQSKIYQNFHHSLKKRGFLVIGLEETLVGLGASSMYYPILPSLRIHMKRTTR